MFRHIEKSMGPIFFSLSVSRVSAVLFFARARHEPIKSNVKRMSPFYAKGKQIKRRCLTFQNGLSMARKVEKVSLNRYGQQLHRVLTVCCKHFRFCFTLLGYKRLKVRVYQKNNVSFTRKKTLQQLQAALVYKS